MYDLLIAVPARETEALTGIVAVEGVLSVIDEAEISVRVAERAVTSSILIMSVYAVPLYVPAIGEEGKALLGIVKSVARAVTASSSRQYLVEPANVRKKYFLIVVIFSISF